MQARPEKIGAFNREVWANCPAAPAAVSAAPLTTVCVAEHCSAAYGKGCGTKTAVVSRKTCRVRFSFCISEGMRKGRRPFIRRAFGAARLFRRA